MTVVNAREHALIIGRPREAPADAYDVVKWVALAAMIGDHVALTLLEPGCVLHDALRALGRCAIPLFTWILASRIAYADDPERTALRVLTRLVGFGLLALPPIHVLGEPFPWMNALLELAALTAGFAAVHALEFGRWRCAAYAAASLASPLLGEYGLMWWAGGVFAYIVLRYGPGKHHGMAAGVVGLSMAVPLAWLGLVSWPGAVAAAVGPRLALAFERRNDAWRTRPQRRWLWYAAYPAHLAVLALLATWAG